MSDGNGHERGSLVVLRGEGQPAEPEVNPETVELLEMLLEEARRGTIVSLMFVGERPDGCVRTAWTNGFDYLRRIAALESMKHDWLTRMHLEGLTGRDL